MRERERERKREREREKEKERENTRETQREKECVQHVYLLHFSPKPLLTETQHYNIINIILVFVFPITTLLVLLSHDWKS